MTNLTGAADFIPHEGGPCPVAEATFPLVKLRDGSTGIWLAAILFWEHDGRGDDIVGYIPEEELP